MTTVTAKSPAELDSEADRLETRAQVLEGEYCAARREAARLRATAAALRAVTAAEGGLAQAQDALDAAQAGYEAAQAGERESTRRCQAAEAEAEKATDALNWAKERQAEPHELVTLEERLSACARVAEHEAGAAAGAEHDARMARRALDHARNALPGRTGGSGRRAEGRGQPAGYRPAWPGVGGQFVFCQRGSVGPGRPADAPRAGRPRGAPRASLNVGLGVKAAAPSRSWRDAGGQGDQPGAPAPGPHKCIKERLWTSGGAE